MFSLATFLVTILAIVSGLRVLAQTSGTTTLSYDTTYNNAALSLNDVACSDGPNGLESQSPNYTTLGSLPTFPNVGGVFTVTEWDSPECGTCYAVTYNSGPTVNILAVDKSTTGFTVSETAMNTLTGDQATFLGRINVSYVQVDASVCGL